MQRGALSWDLPESLVFPAPGELGYSLTVENPTEESQLYCLWHGLFRGEQGVANLGFITEGLPLEWPDAPWFRLEPGGSLSMDMAVALEAADVSYQLWLGASRPGEWLVHLACDLVSPTSNMLRQLVTAGAAAGGMGLAGMVTARVAGRLRKR